MAEKAKKAKINKPLEKDVASTQVAVEVIAATEAKKEVVVEKYAKVNENNLDSSEVYDEGDIASAIELGFIAQALERHKEKMAPEKHPDFDGTHCVDCWVDIHPVRLGMGKVRCKDCQEELEKINKLHGRR